MSKPDLLKLYQRYEREIAANGVKPACEMQVDDLVSDVWDAFPELFRELNGTRAVADMLRTQRDEAWEREQLAMKKILDLEMQLQALRRRLAGVER